MSSKLTVTVTASNAATTTRISSTGRYKRLLTNGIKIDLPAQPLYTSTDEKAYWLAVLAAVTEQITALP